MPVDGNEERLRLKKMMKLFRLSAAAVRDVVDVLQSRTLVKLVDDKTLIIPNAVVVDAKEYLRNKVDPWQFLTEKENASPTSRFSALPRVPPGADIQVEDVEYIPNVGDMVRYKFHAI
jgi:hypothetical protein